MYETVRHSAPQAGVSAGKSRYDRLAYLYDFLAAIYSGGGIRRAKSQHVCTIQAGQRVLYVGSGTGSECVLAAEAGADVTIAELSLSMLERCKGRFNKAKQAATFLHADALSLHEERPFDVIVAPFFLNTLNPTGVARALDRFSFLLRPGGRLVCVDFRAPQGSWGFRKLQEAFYLPPLLLFRLLTGNPWHELYDYDALSRFATVQLTIVDRRVTRAWGLGLLETITWQVHSPSPL